MEGCLYYVRMSGSVLYGQQGRNQNIFFVNNLALYYSSFLYGLLRWYLMNLTFFCHIDAVGTAQVA